MAVAGEKSIKNGNSYVENAKWTLKIQFFPRENSRDVLLDTPVSLKVLAGEKSTKNSNSYVENVKCQKLQSKASTY